MTIDLDIRRHSAAHLMAQALTELYPGIQLGVGPVTETGFFYDIAWSQPLSEKDLEAIESRMKAWVEVESPIVRQVRTKEEALGLFESLGQSLKVELIQSFPEDVEITTYQQGNFIDLCRGPHLSNTGQIGKGFKLTHLGGSQWKGDAARPLQRIYGTCWSSSEELEVYLKAREEAERRDHRKVGQVMDLFHMQSEAPGDVFWHPKGWSLYQTLVHFMRKEMQKRGYQEIHTPHFVNRSLWEASGHWDKFKHAMFTSQVDESVFGLKPMNCPCHVQVFKHHIRSYRDLPLRLSEFGSCMRYEPSGSLMGLMRMRSFTQDDAHIFCTPEQVVSETQAFCAFLDQIYQAFGFKDVMVRFSDRPKERHGDDALWDGAEQALREGAQAAGLTWKENPGEGAFYGPKLEFVLQDCLGRQWQCGTLQLDFVLPQRLGATYVGKDGQEHVPIMLHRAILGSLERFIGILLEHTGGNLPFWLAPTQIAIATLNDTPALVEWASHIQKTLVKKGCRVVTAFGNKTLTHKIRDLSQQKIPQIWVIGHKEQEKGSVTIRYLGSSQQESLDLHQAYANVEALGLYPQ